MKMTNQERNYSPTQPFIHSGRLGFHYFPDTLHYTDRDLQQWLPILGDLGANWLVIRTDTNRAIPENFISSLKESGINPLIQFNLPLGRASNMDDVSPLISAYSRWGATHFQFYDRPNLRSAWSAGGWTQQDLVERFLDRFLPLAALVVKENAVPVMPALEPGGNFWDTAFLRTALQSMERRDQTEILDKLALSAYAWTHRRSIDWGAGGPEYWPDARPYFTPANSQDQRGFRIYQWYQAVAQAVLQRPCPMFLLQAGLPSHPDQLKAEELASAEHTALMQDLYTWATGKELDGQKSNAGLPPASLDMPGEIEACNFWLLSAGREDPYRPQAWFQSGNPHLPHAQAIAKTFPVRDSEDLNAKGIGNDAFFRKVKHPISHYILLANGQRGGWEQSLASLLPFITKTHPTIGFSIDEALLASRVTIIGKSPFITEETLARLVRNGCQINRIEEDGTVLA